MKRRTRRLRVAAWLLGPLGVVVLVGAAGWLATGYRGVTAAGGSMEPTYSIGARLLIERVDGDEVRRGDVVLLSMPSRYGGRPVLQRVVGLGGDRVAHAGGPTGPTRLNGRELAEPYLRGGEANGGPAYDVRVPPGRLFLMGDQRGDSNDSRYFPSDHAGSVPLGAVQGRVVDSPVRPLVIAGAGVAGLGSAIGGLACGVAARQARRRDEAMRLAGWPVQE
ncbi:signal peptidase I [Streptomyces xanthii]|uniref:Signal peptidase I n=1 Tax=Streptomyces xanthii TaxID=2768069 RepID=A0A7H1BAW5_9ACTN|nr:signal peptidase I [Streptomyces xanthii]QNS05870.1 signal peptidase I [Streptomyces xanthii]